MVHLSVTSINALLKHPVFLDQMEDTHASLQVNAGPCIM